MYVFISFSTLSTFLLKFGIDISLLSGFELGVIVLLGNILSLLFYIFVIALVYKFICRVLRWF